MKTIKCDRCGYTDAATGNFIRILIRIVPDFSHYENKTTEEIIAWKKQCEYAASLANYSASSVVDKFFDLCKNCKVEFERFLTPDSSGAGENHGGGDDVADNRSGR